MSKNLTYTYEKIILGRIHCEKAPQVVRACLHNPFRPHGPTSGSKRPLMALNGPQTASNALLSPSKSFIGTLDQGKFKTITELKEKAKNS